MRRPSVFHLLLRVGEEGDIAEQKNIGDPVIRDVPADIERYAGVFFVIPEINDAGPVQYS